MKQAIMDPVQLQDTLFQEIKLKLPTHLSLVIAISELLDLSLDSTYRRIRGEKLLVFDEIHKLALEFNISLDKIFQISSDTFLFKGRIINNTDFNYEEWLKLCIYQLQMIKDNKPNHMYYLAKEIPFFYYFLIPEIAAFKSYFIMKSVLDYEELKQAKFSVTDDFSYYSSWCKKISDLFSSIPSTEIWHVENITSTIHQIEYYRLTGSLNSDNDALILYDKLMELINHLERQAECGFKLSYGQENGTSEVIHKMFINELTLGDNMQFIQAGDAQITYINHSTINFIATYNESFNQYTKKNIDTITQKSTPISVENQKERLMFFNRLREKVLEAIRNVEKVAEL